MHRKTNRCIADGLAKEQKKCAHDYIYIYIRYFDNLIILLKLRYTFEIWIHQWVRQSHLNVHTHFIPTGAVNWSFDNTRFSSSRNPLGTCLWAPDGDQILHIILSDDSWNLLSYRGWGRRDERRLQPYMLYIEFDALMYIVPVYCYLIYSYFTS